MPCCCGKYIDDELLPFVSNGTMHEQLGEDGAFCGTVDSHTIRDMRNKIDKISYHTMKLAECYATDINKKICDTDIAFHTAQIMGELGA